ncbi:MAG: DUF2314 domain-containing protein [Candidatus Shapirobacteria bacterium]|nr:DUF2314 domain-containing protein [Candidatus Shapirobacteria bacterium]
MNKLNQKQIFLFSGEDEGMQEAIKIAQEEFPKFKEEIETESKRILPVMTECLIKYAFPSDDNKVKMEHMFLSNIYSDGNNVYGTLVSEPLYTKKVKEGDKIKVELDRVSDWLYIIDDKTHGGYTFKYMWKKFSDFEKEKYRNHPPFCWLELN